MKAVIQRVSSASCVVDDKEISKIDKGLLILVGFGESDDINIVKKTALKISKMRIFSDEFDKMNKDLNYVNGSILCISQFTLYGSLKDGNRPSFTKSLKWEEADKLYNLFLEELKTYFPNRVFEGVFKANMQIHLINDGPVTILLDSDELFV